MFTRSVFCCLFVALAVPAAGLATPSLALSSGAALPGSVVSVPLSFDPAGDPVAALQWTFQFPASQITAVAVTAGPAAQFAGKTVACVGGPGFATCVLYGLNTTLLGPGVVANASFSISPFAQGPSSAIQVVNALGTSDLAYGDGINGIGSSIILSGASTVSVSGLACIPSTISPGASSTCTASLAGAAPTSGATLSVSSDNSAVSVPAAVVVSGGASSATFAAAATPVTADATATIRVASGASAATTTVTVMGSSGGSSTLSFSPPSLSFATGGSLSQSLAIGSTTTGLLIFSATASAPWIRLSPSSGFVNSTSVTVTADPTGLAAGNYSGTIAFTTSGAATYSASVPVFLTVAGGGGSSPSTLTVNPASIAVAYNSLTGPTPGPVAIQVSSTGSPVTFTAATGDGNWLSLPGAPGAQFTTPYSLAVSINVTGLQPGVYTSAITLTPSLGTAVTIPVTLTVSGGTSTGSSTIGVSPSSLSFLSNSGAAPPSQTVTLSNSGTAISYSLAISGSWLSASPASGTAPGLLTVSVNPTGLAGGTYQGTITVIGGSAVQTIAVALTVLATLPTMDSATNGASYSPGALAPGEIVVITGSTLGPAAITAMTVDSSTGMASTLVGGTQVLFNGAPGPVLYSSATQVAAIVPYQLSGKTSTTVQVKYLGVGSNVMTFPITGAAPAIFTLDASGVGEGAILNQDGTVNGPGNPADKGSIVVLYATGEGQTAPQGITGLVTSGPDFPAPLLPVTALVDGQAATVMFAGEAPATIAGVMQVNLQIPSDAKSGSLPVILSIGSAASQPGVTVAVR